MVNQSIILKKFRACNINCCPDTILYDTIHFIHTSEFYNMDRIVDGFIDRYTDLQDAITEIIRINTLYELDRISIIYNQRGHVKMRVSFKCAAKLICFELFYITSIHNYNKLVNCIIDRIKTDKRWTIEGGVDFSCTTIIYGDNCE